MKNSYFIAILLTAISFGAMADKEEDAKNHERCVQELRNQNFSLVTPVSEEYSFIEYNFMKGYFWAIKKNNETMTKDARMDQRYGFEHLTQFEDRPRPANDYHPSTQHYYPPVIEPANCEHPSALNLATGQEKSCYIIHSLSEDKKKQDTELTWRDYLVATEDNNAFRKAFDDFTKSYFQVVTSPQTPEVQQRDWFCHGVGYANKEFKKRLYSLEKDFKGMKLYVDLSTKGKIKATPD